MPTRDHAQMPRRPRLVTSGALPTAGTWIEGWLHAERCVWQAAFRPRSFYVLLAFLLLALLLAPQLPLHYMIDVGKEEGYGSDLPHLQGFHAAERDIHGTFRWTRDGATIVLPGLGRRPLLVDLTFFPISAQVATAGPRTIEVWSGTERLALLPVRPDGARFRLAVPARHLPDGKLTLTLHTETFSPPDDPRQIGTPLAAVQITSLPSALPVMPDWQAVGIWLFSAILAWLTVLRALGAISYATRRATGWLGCGIALVALAAVFDPPRWAAGAIPALVTLALCYVLTLVLRAALPLLAKRAGIALDPHALGWLVLIVVMAFGLRYGGRLYPRSMHGDIGFHTNRLHETALGQVYLLSRNRGVDFPYPSGPYLTLAPLTLFRIATPDLLQVSAALVEGLGAILVFTLVILATTPVFVLPTQAARRTALLAAAIYVFSAAGFMTTWWSFSTHIYTQFTTLVLITALMYTAQQPVSRGWHGVMIGVLLVGVFLGHFGFFINTALLIGVLLVLLRIVLWQQAAWCRRLWWPLLLAGAGALMGVLVFFYSAYLPLFISQAQAVATGGMTGLAQRAPVERSYLWHTLWYSGMITHFGFFPLLLSVPGMLTLLRRGPSAHILLALLACTLLVSIPFAILPFITLSTQSTRWLMFSAWAVAVGAALAMRVLWCCGRAGRVVVLAMAGFMLWNTATLWLGAMIWRIRPPEPF